MNIEPTLYVEEINLLHTNLKTFYGGEIKIITKVNLQTQFFGIEGDNQPLPDAQPLCSTPLSDLRLPVQKTS